MNRRRFITASTALGLTFHPLVRAWAKPAKDAQLKLAGPPKPVFIYNNWSAYDELSDNKPQTEELAMNELGNIIRLKQSGVQIDYYVMDAFWFDKWGGYRTWHKKHWPNGPDKWLETCKENGIKPGMWFSTNLIATQSGRFLEVIPEWRDSLGSDPNIMCLFEGGYTKHLADSLQLWYNKGVRLFKFDFAYFEAVTPASKGKYTAEEVLEKNKVAFMQMLQQFRAHNPDVLITGYNGFGGDMENTYTPFNKKIDPRWLDNFDTLYCGDPRFSDVPMMNIWRSQDNYSDHQVFAYQAYGMPIRRIDNCAFMIGKTGTCYYRATQCWKGMLILELARGGWVNVYHGNLELLSNEDAKWFAKVQGLYHNLQRADNTVTFGSIPGKGQPYGFKSSSTKGTVCTVVNPSQQVATIELPIELNAKARILYSDGGYRPQIKGNHIILGSEQLTVIATGEYAADQYNLGVDETTRSALFINKIEAQFSAIGKNAIQAKVYTDSNINPDDTIVRIIVQQFDADDQPYRSWPGAPPDGKKITDVIKIEATQDGRPLSLHVEYDKVIWSGLSWGAAEINDLSRDRTKPVTITCRSAEEKELKLKAQVYNVIYGLPE